MTSREQICWLPRRRGKKHLAQPGAVEFGARIGAKVLKFLRLEVGQLITIRVQCPVIFTQVRCQRVGWHEPGLENPGLAIDAFANHAAEVHVLGKVDVGQLSVILVPTPSFHGSRRP